MIVTATDAVGNVGELGPYDLIVIGQTRQAGAEILSTVLTSTPPTSTPATTATFAFTATGSLVAAPDLAFECSLDSGPWTACRSLVEYRDLAQGEHLFQVRAYTPEMGFVEPSPAFFVWRVGPQAPNTVYLPFVAKAPAFGAQTGATIYLPMVRK